MLRDSRRTSVKPLMSVPVAACFVDSAGLLQHSPLVGSELEETSVTYACCRNKPRNWFLFLFFNNLLNSWSLITPPFSFYGELLVGLHCSAALKYLTHFKTGLGCKVVYHVYQ